MKKSNFLFGAVAALAMGGAFTACSDDMPTQGIDNGVAEYDQTRYLSVTIGNPPSNGSRAADADFEQGTDLENYVHDLYFVFYDAAGVPTGESYHLRFSDNANNSDGTNNLQDDGKVTGAFTTNTSGNVGKVWTSVIPVQLAQGANLPSYVMAFVNPVSSADLVTKTLSVLDDETRNLVQLSDNHFPMSNSVYYGNDPISGETNVRMVATPVTTSQLYNTEAEAAAEGASSVDIYVERYAAKVNLTIAANSISDEIDASTGNAVNGYKLKFVPEYWRTNAIDEKTYVVKRYGVIENGVTNYKPTYAQMVANFNNRTWWNDANLYRSYWAASPSYYANDFPTVSDDVTDLAEGSTTEKKNSYLLHYFSYNEIKNNKLNGADTNKTMVWSATDGKFVDADGNESAFYASETTASSSAWNQGTNNSYNPLAVMASAVIVGHYEVTATGDKATVNTGDTFWLYGKSGSKWNLYASEQALVTAMALQQNTVLKNVAAEDETPIYQTVTVGDGQGSTVTYASGVFKAEHPSQAVREAAGVTVAGRLTALQLDADKLTGQNLYYYDSTKGSYVEVTASNVVQVNEDLLTAGYARQYGHGKCYFNIPIEHLGIYQNSTVSGSTGTYVEGAKKDGEYVWESCPTGSFGIVRNHVYNISISKISGLATALYDEDQPIVPPVDDVTYYISAKLDILNWRIVPTQSVEL